MSISQVDFEKACVTFQTAWQRVNAGTEWDEVKILENYGTKYLQIRKRVKPVVHEPAESAHSTDLEHELEDDNDQEALDRSGITATSYSVRYDIFHSSSYQVPVLYIRLKQHTADGQRTRSVSPPDEMYTLLVPSSHRAQVQAVGIVGALSMTDHPASNTPAYFVHPCLTAEAMSTLIGGRKLEPEEYLLIWLGLSGPGVGLNVPVELARAISDSA